MIQSAGLVCCGCAHDRNVYIRGETGKEQEKAFADIRAGEHGEERSLTDGLSD
jgi:hypothetical protein